MGTGFFDQVKLIDTSKDPSEMAKSTPVEALPSTSDVGKAPKTSINPNSLPKVSAERMIEQTKKLNPKPEITHPVAKDDGGLDTVAKEVVKDFPLSSQFKSVGSQIVKVARSQSLWKGNYVMALISGDPKGGKSGMVLDSLTEEEIANGAEIWHIDFDMGGETTKAAHHKDKAANLIVMSPYVLIKNAQSETPFDFHATYQRVLDILNHAYEQAVYQRQYFEKNGKMPTPYLKTICFDGADQWLNICGTVMKIVDLNLGDSGVAVTGQKTTTKIGRFNWEFRKNRYRAALTTGLQETARLGVHCYVITHMKPSYDRNGNEILGADVPDILPRSEGDYQQRINVRTVEERDPKTGEKTGVNYGTATLTENRTSLRSGEEVILFRRDAEGGEWFGYKGLQDGSFHHTGDVLGSTISE
jgi:hypothetical protein